MRINAKPRLAFVFWLATALAAGAQSNLFQTGFVFAPIQAAADTNTEQALSPYARLTAGEDYLVKISGSPGSSTMTLDLRTLPQHDQFEEAMSFDVLLAADVPAIAAIIQQIQSPGGGGIDALRNMAQTSRIAAEALHQLEPSSPVPALSVNGYNLYATTQANEPVPIYAGKTLWYYFTVEQNGSVTFQIQPSSDNYVNHGLTSAYLTVWTGTNLGQLTLVAQNRMVNTNRDVNPYLFPAALTFLAHPYTSYFLRVDAVSAAGEFVLQRTFEPSAPNDNLNEALTLKPQEKDYANGTRVWYTTAGFNYGAGTEWGEPLDLYNTVWYRLAAALPGNLNAQVDNPSNTVAVFLATNVAAVAFSNLTRVHAPLPVNPGEVYYLAVGGEQGEFALQADVTPPPSNDYLTNAIAHTGVFDYFTYNYYATLGDPQDAHLPGISNSLWWTIHPVRDGTLAVRDQQSDLTTDNWRLYDSAFQLVRPERSSSDTKVYPVGNQTHYFWFAGPDSEIGEQELLFEQVDRPANDNFSDAAPITGYTSDVYANGEARSYPVTGWNNGLTEPGDPISNAVWYVWSAPQDGYLAVTNRSRATLLIAQGDTNSQLNLLPNPAAVSAGQELRLAVGGEYDHFQLQLDWRPPPSNDYASNALALTAGEPARVYTRYATLDAPDDWAVGDLWFTYDPAPAAGQPEIRIQAANPVALEVYQGGARLSRSLCTNADLYPLNAATNTPVLLRVLVPAPDTDLTITEIDLAPNDNFAQRTVVDLQRVAWTTPTPLGDVPMEKYQRHACVDNRNATLETQEANVALHETALLAGRSLWWEIHPPTAYGMLTIRSRNGSAPTHFEIAFGTNMPASTADYVAWNQIAQENWVTLSSIEGQTILLRADTSLQAGSGLIDFDITFVPYPQNDFIETADGMQEEDQGATTHYLGKYYLNQDRPSFFQKGTIYGGTRQLVLGALTALEDTVNAAVLAAGATNVFPAGQSVWYALSPSQGGSYVLDVSGCNFDPLVVLVQGDPHIKGGRLLASGQAADLQAGTQYYLCVDANLGRQQYTNFYPQNGLLVSSKRRLIVNGLSTDFNRPTQDSIPGALNVRLTCAGQPPNDQQPQTIPLTATYASNGNCDSRSVYYGYGIQDNSLARAAAQPIPGGAGKSLFWRIQPAVDGLLQIDASDSACPVLTRVVSTGQIFTTNRFQIIVQAAREVVLETDSAAGTTGIIVAAATQDAARPHNDLFSQAREIVSPLTCGELQNSTIEPGESLIGSGSIWYRWHNYAGSNQDVTFTLFGGKHLSVYRGNQITNLVPVSVDSASFSYHSGTNENLFLRVYDTDYPPSGDIQIAMDTGTNFYLGQFYITPSTPFPDRLPINAASLSSAQLTFRYSTNGSVSPQAPEFMGMVLTNSANLQFLVQFPDGSSFVVNRAYQKVTTAQLTRSQAFQGSLLVGVTNIPPGASVMLSRGDGNGGPPDGLYRPATALLLSDSAWVSALVTVPNVGQFQLDGHYTNSVENPRLNWLDDHTISLVCPTPQSGLVVQQNGASQEYPTNQIALVPDAPIIQVLGTRPGWMASSNQFDLSANYTNDLMALVVRTNNADAHRIRLSISNPNLNSYIWYQLSRADGVSLQRCTNQTLDLDAPYSFFMTAFAASPTQNRRGPVSQVSFTAQLVAPTITQESGTITISNLNLGVPTALWVNDVDMGSVPVWQLTDSGEGIVRAYATSPVAQNSTTNTLAVNYVPYVTVTPPAAVFATNVTVTISSSFGSRLQLHLEQEGAARDQFIAASDATLTLDKTTLLVASAERYGITHSRSTNSYQGQVTVPDIILPPLGADGTYPTISPIIARTPTPGAQIQYAVNFGPWNASADGSIYMNEGTNYYRIKATRPYWLDSDPISVQTAASTPIEALVNYVGRYYTLLPDLPLHISPANTALVDTPTIQYQHLIWMPDGSASPPKATELVLNAPVENLLVYHQVVRIEVGKSSVEGPVIPSFITVRPFDFQVVDPDPQLQVSPIADDAEKILFYKPVWLRTTLSNVVLQAEGDVAAYSLEPVRQGDRYLIPGNLAGKDRLTLRYRVNGGDWKRFFMKFKTLEPEQVIQTNKAVTVILSQNYSGHPVDTFYQTNTPPTTTEPFANAVEIFNLRGQFPFTPANPHDYFWVNSQYSLTNLAEMVPYRNLPIVPLQ